MISNLTEIVNFCKIIFMTPDHLKSGLRDQPSEGQRSSDNKSLTPKSFKYFTVPLLGCLCLSGCAPLTIEEQARIANQATATAFSAEETKIAAPKETEFPSLLIPTPIENSTQSEMNPAESQLLNEVRTHTPDNITSLRLMSGPFLGKVNIPDGVNVRSLPSENSHKTRPAFRQGETVNANVAVKVYLQNADGTTREDTWLQLIDSTGWVCAQRGNSIYITYSLQRLNILRPDNKPDGSYGPINTTEYEKHAENVRNALIGRGHASQARESQRRSAPSFSSRS
jgi:hypothetical protein